MGNKTPKIIGGALATIAITFALVALIPAITETTTSTSGLATFGHVTLTIYDPDGNLVGYSQSDNFVQKPALDNLQQGLFVTGTFTNSQFKFLSLCTGATPQTDNACTGEMSNTPRLDGTAGAGDSTSVANPSQTQDIFTGTITLTTSDDNTNFSELALFDADTAGNLFSVATFTTFLGQTGTQVKVTYTINMAG